MSTSEQLRISQEASTVPFYVLHNSTTIDNNPKHATITLFTLKEQDKRLLQFNKLHNATRIEYDKLKYPTSTILSSALLPHNPPQGPIWCVENANYYTVSFYRARLLTISQEN